MIAVEKIGGVPGVERKRLKTGKGLEHGGGPLPAIACELRKTGSAGRSGNRDFVPGVEIVVPASVGREICSAMELRFGGQALALPPGVRGGLLVRHVNRPGQRQRNLAE